MSFTTWSIRNPLPCVLFFLLLSFFGIYCFHTTIIKNSPDFKTRRFAVALALPGASPEQIEKEVTIPVENSLVSLDELRSLSSFSSQGNSELVLRFSHKRSSIRCLMDIKAALRTVRPYLPKGVQTARIRHISVSVGYSSATWAVTSNTMSLAQLTWFVKNKVYPAISAAPGFRLMTLRGEVNRDVEVQINPARLYALGLTSYQVTRALRSIETERSGGEAHLAGALQGVRVIDTDKTLAEIKHIEIPTSHEGPVSLGSIANVYYGHGIQSGALSLDGKPAVGFKVYDETGHDELALIKNVAEIIHEIAAQYPQVHFVEVRSEKSDILGEYHQSIKMFIEGTMLAILVIFLFLRNIRSTLIGALALPLSILPTFIFIKLAGYSLNWATLLAFLVVVGILVDDAIVEIENIYRHLKTGVSLKEATASAVSEIGLSVIATSLALVVVFLPTSFMRGFSGEIFRQFGWTACVAVLASLLVARMLTPILAVAILKNDEPDRQESRIGKLYTRAVRWSVNHKLIVIALTASAIGASVLLYKALPTGYVPPSEESYTVVNIKLAPNATITEALAAAQTVRQAILSKPNPVPGIAHVFARVGDAGWDTNGGPGVLTEIDDITMTIAFTPRDTRPSEAQIETDIRNKIKNIPGMEISVNGSGFGTRLDLTLAGTNPTILYETAKAVERQMRTIKGLTGINSNLESGETDVVIKPKAALAATLDVTTSDIARAVRIATAGDYGSRLPQFNLGNRRVGIRVRLDPRFGENLAYIRQLRIPSKSGLIPLSVVASVSLQTVPMKISRYNREQFVTVSADLDGMPLGEAFAKVSALPVMQHLPKGVHWIKMGESRLMTELFKDFGGELALSTLLIYALLVLLFKDPFQPITVICAVPLCLGGALIGVWASGSSIDLPVFLGFVLLLGLATKNSILLVDYAQRTISSKNVSAKEAILEACHIRARPILMTTVAMTAGMIPLMVSFGGEDVSFSAPMAAAVIGGLIGSTVLSLFFVPVMFLIVERVKSGSYWVFRKAHALNARTGS